MRIYPFPFYRDWASCPRIAIYRRNCGDLKPYWILTWLSLLNPTESWLFTWNFLFFDNFHSGGERLIFGLSYLTLLPSLLTTVQDGGREHILNQSQVLALVPPMGIPLSRSPSDDALIKLIMLAFFGNPFFPAWGNPLLTLAYSISISYPHHKSWRNTGSIGIILSSIEWDSIDAAHLFPNYFFRLSVGRRINISGRGLTQKDIAASIQNFNFLRLLTTFLS